MIVKSGSFELLVRGSNPMLLLFPSAVGHGRAWRPSVNLRTLAGRDASNVVVLAVEGQMGTKRADRRIDLRRREAVARKEDWQRLPTDKKVSSLKARPGKSRRQLKKLDAK